MPAKGAMPAQAGWVVARGARPGDRFGVYEVDLVASINLGSDLPTAEQRIDDLTIPILAAIANSEMAYHSAEIRHEEWAENGSPARQYVLIVQITCEVE